LGLVLLILSFSLTSFLCLLFLDDTYKSPGYTENNQKINAEITAHSSQRILFSQQIADLSQENFFSAENFAKNKESLENDQQSVEKTEYLIDDHSDSTSIANREKKDDSKETGILLIDSNTYLIFKLS
jgi:hypothetical protein